MSPKLVEGLAAAARFVAALHAADTSPLPTVLGVTDAAAPLNLLAGVCVRESVSGRGGCGGGTAQYAGLGRKRVCNTRRCIARSSSHPLAPQRFGSDCSVALANERGGEGYYLASETLSFWGRVAC